MIGRQRSLTRTPSNYVASTLSSSYLLRGESPMTVGFLIKHQQQLDDYETILDALAELPSEEALTDALKEQEVYCEALKTSLDAKEFLLKAIAKQLPQSENTPPPTSPLKSIKSVTSLSNFFNKRLGGSPSSSSSSRLATAAAQDESKKLQEVYQQEEHALDLLKAMQRNSDNAFEILRSQLHQRDLLSMQASEVVLEIFDGQTPDFPEEDEVERNFSRLLLKCEKAKKDLEFSKLINDDTLCVWEQLTRAYKLLRELLAKTSSDLITDHLFQNAKGQEFFSTRLAEYEKCLEESLKRISSALQVLPRDHSDAELFRNIDISGLRKILLINKSHVPSKSDIRAGIDSFKAPLNAFHKASLRMEAIYSSCKSRYRALQDDLDRVERELDRTRKSILVRAISIRRASRGLHPLHPEHVPPQLRMAILSREAEFDELSDNSSVNASYTAANMAAASAQVRMQEIRSGKLHRTYVYDRNRKLTRSSKASQLSRSSRTSKLSRTSRISRSSRSTLSPKPSITSSMMSIMEKEHDEYQANANANAASHASATLTATVSAFVSSAETGLLNRTNSGRYLLPQRTNSERRHLRSMSMDSRIIQPNTPVGSAESDWTISTSAAYSISSDLEAMSISKENRPLSTDQWTISSGAASITSDLDTPSLTTLTATTYSASQTNTPELIYSDYPTTMHVQHHRQYQQPQRQVSRNHPMYRSGRGSSIQSSNNFSHYSPTLNQTAEEEYEEDAQSDFGSSIFEQEGWVEYVVLKNTPEPNTDEGGNKRESSEINVIENEKLHDDILEDEYVEDNRGRKREKARKSKDIAAALLRRRSL